MKVAAPGFLGNDFQHAPPGHRFSLYFRGWSDAWEFEKGQKRKALETIKPLLPEHLKASEALYERQAGLAQSMGLQALRVDSESVSPFVTGIGIEHPVENGFAFLNPYGIPYLPGSSVKGVVRKAAEELLFTDVDSGIDLIDLWAWFGFEENSVYLLSREGAAEYAGLDDSLAKTCCDWRESYNEHVSNLDNGKVVKFLGQIMDPADCPDTASATDFLLQLPERPDLRKNLKWRGLLRFWDAFPRPQPDFQGQSALDVQILTPHYGEYYSGKTTPHDSGQPVPNFFLGVPPRSRFTFYVQVADRGLNHFSDHWRASVENIFNYAFDWMGFGARTSTGYGQLTPDESLAEENREAEEIAVRALQRANLAVEQVKIAELLDQLGKAQDANQKDPNGPLRQSCTMLMKEAAGWEVGFREELINAVKQVFDYLLGTAWKKNKKIKEQLNQLRDE